MIYKTFLNFIALLCLVLAMNSILAGQEAGFEDARGDSSIFLDDAGGFARVNITDTSARIGFLHEKSSTGGSKWKEGYRFGFDLTGKLSNGVANVFDGFTAAPGAKINVSIGKKFLISPPPAGEEIKSPLTLDWITFQVGYGRTRLKLLSENSNFADQIQKKDFDTYSAKLAYNALFSNKNNGPLLPRGSILFGISAGIERRNNIDDLTEVEVNDQVFTSSNNTTQRSVVATQKAFRGDYKEFNAYPINSDLVWFPLQLKSRVGVNFFTRSNVGAGGKYLEPGIGVFLTKAGKPTNVIGGVSFSVRNGESRVGLIAGYNF